MFFSVIIPVYNVEEYLEECIESVINQTYRAYEIILVNDGSSDNSGTICEKYTTMYSDKIKTMHQTNKGPLLARRKGIKSSIGDVLIFLDADDCLRNDCLEILNNNFEETNCDMIIFNASIENDYSKSFRKYNLHSTSIFQNETKKVLYEKVITTSEMNNLATKAIKSKLFEEIYEDACLNDVRHGEDLLQFLPLITRASKILLIDENLYYYRQRIGSLTHKFDMKRLNSIKIVHQEMEKYIDVWGMQEYHSKHYAREVKGWIETLHILLNEKKIKYNQYIGCLHEMGEDVYFVRAYENMDKKQLSKMNYLLATFLYKRKYRYIEFFRLAKKLYFWR